VSFRQPHAFAWARCQRRRSRGVACVGIGCPLCQVVLITERRSPLFSNQLLRDVAAVGVQPLLDGDRVLANRRSILSERVLYRNLAVPEREQITADDLDSLAIL